MSRKKVWTFDSICRAARRKAKNWRLVPDTSLIWWGGEAPTNVSCARGYCPLGVVFAWGKRKRPDELWLDKHAKPTVAQLRVAQAIMSAADTATDPNRPRMLKLLGITS